jgi:phosphoglycolate phosphatase
MAKRIAALFDIDGTLIITGEAGAAAWRLAFNELYGIPSDIGEYTDTGMTDPDVGHKTFRAVLAVTPAGRSSAS